MDEEFYDQIIERMGEEKVEKVAFYAGSRLVNFNTACTRIRLKLVKEMYDSGASTREIADVVRKSIRQVERYIEDLKKK